MTPAPVAGTPERRSPAAVWASHEGDRVKRSGQAKTALAALLLLGLLVPFGRGQTACADGPPAGPAGRARHAGLGRGGLPRLRPRRAGRPQRPGVPPPVRPGPRFQLLGLALRARLPLRRRRVLGPAPPPASPTRRRGRSTSASASSTSPAGRPGTTPIGGRPAPSPTRSTTSTAATRPRRRPATRTASVWRTATTSPTYTTRWGPMGSTRPGRPSSAWASTPRKP